MTNKFIQIKKILLDSIGNVSKIYLMSNGYGSVFIAVLRPVHTVGFATAIFFFFASNGL